MCISKESALKVIKRSLSQTQFKIRHDLDFAVLRQNRRLHATKNKELEENQTVLDLINLELMKFMDDPNTLN